MRVKCCQIDDLVDAIKQESRNAVVKVKSDVSGNVSEIWIKEGSDAIYTIWVSPCQPFLAERYCVLQASVLGKGNLDLNSVIARFEDPRQVLGASVSGKVFGIVFKVMDFILRAFESEQSTKRAINNALLRFDAINGNLK